MAHPPKPSIRDLVLDHVTRVLNGPAYPEKSFVDGYTFADVYRMAENLKSAWSGLPLKNAIIGLFTENKAAIAASVLAALNTGYILVMPHGFSRQGHRYFLYGRFHGQTERMAQIGPEHLRRIRHPVHEIRCPA